MKINFIPKNRNMSRGSYRIHVHDLNLYLNDIGVQSNIGGDGDVHIYDKAAPVMNRGKINGVITPSADNVSLIKSVDFVIVGSVEEKESIIPFNKNVFIFPQIEHKYLSVKRKNHFKKEQTVIGYHGNPNHLNHMSLGLCRALERLNKEYNISLLVMCSKLASISDSTMGKPNMIINYIPWSLDTISYNINKFDIGIVPNVCAFNAGNFNDQNLANGVYGTDIRIRFKNKSNIGRSLVLIQHGIPVVCDITPSNMHLFANPDNGYAVLTEHGWYNAIKSLMSDDERNRISNNAFEEYKRLYNPQDWARKLAISIRGVLNEKNNRD